MTKEEAIRRIKSWNLDSDDMEVLSVVIPELAESEDERIRRKLFAILEWAKCYGDCGFTPDEVKEIITYLEKQKPAEIKPRFKIGDTLKKKNKDYTFVVDKIQGGFYLTSDEHFFPIEEQDSWELLEQKPVELDEDIKMNLDRALQIIKKAKGNLQGYQSDDGIYECDKAIECLENFLYHGIEIEKTAEWRDVELTFRGEEVKVKRQFFRDDKGHEYSTTEQDEDVAWHALRAWCEKKGVSLYDLYPREEWSEDEKARIDRIVDVLDWAEDKGRISYSDWEEYVCYVKSLKPQLKQEWSEEDETRLKVIKEELERFIMFGQYRTPLSVDDIDWLKTLPERFNLGPKQEWSEEDEEMLTSFLHKVEVCDLLTNKENVWIVKRLKSLRPQQKQEWSDGDEKKLSAVISLMKSSRAVDPFYDKMYLESWLKSLPLNLKKKNEDVAKLCSNEWSEEDEETLQLLISYFGAPHLIPMKINTSDKVVDFKDIASWLKNRFKSLPPQPHTVSIKDATKFGNLEYERGVKDGIQSEKSRQWKPSEEQVEALDDTIFFEKTVFRKKKLVSLLEDLKKLM